MKLKKSAALLLALLLAAALIGCAQTEEAPVEIKALILPKFEIGELSGDDIGEAQCYYEAYLEGGECYEIAGCSSPLYVKDGVALIVTGMGKTNAAATLQAVLVDDRFDFSDAYVLGTGCAGSAVEYGVMGDVFVVTATIDFDAGHRADAREMTTDRETTWFRDSSYDDMAYKLLDQELCEKVYALVKDVPLETTESTRTYMAESFDNAEWATRDPQVLRGTGVTSDCYWKGWYDHLNAVAMTESYGAPDPYAVTEMEDNALSVVLDRLGMLDRFIILRDSVNTDVFMNGASPESLWDENYTGDASTSEAPVDLFETARRNNFKVGKVIIDAILNGEL